MKPKIYVAIALMLSLLVAGIIIILGLSSNVLLPVFLLLFLTIFFATSIFLTRNLLGDNMFAALILIVLLAISATFFLTSLKTYHQILNEYGNPDNSPEISLIQTENVYYAAYADYLVQRVLEYQNQSRLLTNKLSELEKIKAEQLQQESSIQNVSTTTPQIAIPETSYITYYPQEYEEENDD